YGLVSGRRVDRVGRIHPSLPGIWIFLHLRRICSRDRGPCIRELEILEFQHELSVAHVLVLRVCRQHVDFPTGWATVRTNRRLSRRTAHDIPGLGIAPTGARWFNEQSGIQTRLLVCRWSEVIVRENGAHR